MIEACSVQQSQDEACDQQKTQPDPSTRSARPEHVTDIWLRPTNQSEKSTNQKFKQSPKDKEREKWETSWQKVAPAENQYKYRWFGN